MAPARFSAFELLLLKSRYPPDTAALLLLTWVYVNKRAVLAEDRRYLEVLANGYRHSRDLDTLLAIARADLKAIQLAAEVVLRERVDEQSHPFLRRAIGLATSEGDLSPRNHHILRFLSDLSGVTPAAFARLFREVAGRALTPPSDPSRQAYWQQQEQAEPAAEADTDTPAPSPRRTQRWLGWRTRILSAHARRRENRLERDRLRQQARQRAERRRQEEERLQRARQAEAQRQEEERQADAQRRERARQEEASRQEQQRRQRQWQQAAGIPQPHYRIRLALQVLELDEHASSTDIKRAYRRLAQRHHPDRFHGQGDLRISLASQRFQRIKNAYDLLMQHA
ncbi:MAG: molecular chaperone DnaJ [Salinicola sp.]|uniref:J domain-containing protein n=1 Tax=uncultured Salinicola sp. TaxID=1193542 RepID=UPI000C92C516|nr:DnaJ domain-containing protein [uncultured Salinicola sp.]MAM59248.1 molecular chaperone DnaJ [Salinicola sp.]